MSENNVPIFQKTYDLYKLLHSFHQKIPKFARYTLWQKIEKTTLDLIEVIIETGHQKDQLLFQSLHRYSDKLDLLKVLIRLAKETRTIDSQQYAKIQGLIKENGKMIGGWIKFASR